MKGRHLSNNMEQQNGLVYILRLLLNVVTTIKFTIKIKTITAVIHKIQQFLA